MAVTSVLDPYLLVVLKAHVRVLGPVSFLLYFNYITDYIQSTMRLFVDDSIVNREIKSICDHACIAPAGLKQFMGMG